MSKGKDEDASGCALLVGALLVIGLVVAALISLAALVDPFSWLPSVNEIWSECDDDFGTDRDECALANRFPGFWGHVIGNLVYTVIAAGLLFFLWAGVADLREAREGRFVDDEAAERYATTRQGVAGISMVVGLMALIPIVAAVA